MSRGINKSCSFSLGLLIRWTLFIVYTESYTTWPDTHGRVFLVLVQCTLLYTRTLDNSLFTKYQKNADIYIWSPCRKRISRFGIRNQLFHGSEPAHKWIQLVTVQSRSFGKGRVRTYWLQKSTTRSKSHFAEGKTMMNCSGKISFHGLVNQLILILWLGWSVCNMYVCMSRLALFICISGSIL